MKKNKKWLIPKTVVAFIIGFAVAWIGAPYQSDTDKVEVDKILDKVEVEVDIRPFETKTPCTVRMYYREGGEEYVRYYNLGWK